MRRSNIIGNLDPSGGGGSPQPNPDTLKGAELLTASVANAYTSNWTSITDGEFRIPINGVNKDITGLNFSGLRSFYPTPSYLTASIISTTTLAAWQATTAGCMWANINRTYKQPAGFDFSNISSLAEVPSVINVHPDVADFFEILAEQVGVNQVIYTVRTLLVGSKSLAATNSFILAGTCNPADNIASYMELLNTDFPTSQPGTDGIVEIINNAAAGDFVAEILSNGNIIFKTTAVGSAATIGFLETIPGGVGTDISGAGFLAGQSGGGAVITPGSGF